MGEKREHEETEMFLVRVWADRGSGENHLLHGKALHVLSGKGKSFSDGTTLLDFLLTMIQTTQNAALMGEEPVEDKAIMPRGCLQDKRLC